MATRMYRSSLITQRARALLKGRGLQNSACYDTNTRCVLTNFSPKEIFKDKMTFTGIAQVTFDSI
jgi:hypothetical protein